MKTKARTYRLLSAPAHTALDLEAIGLQLEANRGLYLAVTWLESESIMHVGRRMQSYSIGKLATYQYVSETLPTAF